jgi:diguanylate cyclase (GGDEF)-like protein/PAS domain S-box-containing protein
MISYLDAEQRFRFANRAYKDWLGVEPDALLGRTLADFHGERTYAASRAHIEAALAGQRIVYECDLGTVSGWRRVEVTLVPDLRSHGTARGLFVLMRDVTESREAEALRARSEERLSLALEGSNLALFDWDIALDRVYHGPQAAAMRGFPAHEITTDPATLRRGVHPDDQDLMMARIRAAVIGEVDVYDAEFRASTQSGGWLWLRAKGRVVQRDAGGRALRLAGTYVDITQRKAFEERLRHLAEFDVLTGLPNRALFLDRLNQAIARAIRSSKSMALLFLDIDHFKIVNDTLGHEAGDELLAAFARTLQSSVRTSDTVARLGGDEFTIILEGLSGLDDAKAMAQTLVAKVRNVQTAEGRLAAVSTSIGIAMFAEARGDAATLLRRADSALYEAKRLGRDRYACEA